MASPPANPDSTSLRIHRWLLTLTLATIVTGMAYTLWWPAVVRHQSFYWLYPGDIWGTVRAAHWIGWGGFSFIYSSRTGLVTLPGFHALLTPFVILTSHLGLSETAPGLLPVPKPTAWLVIGPVSMASSAVALFGADMVARCLEVSPRRRRALAAGVAAAVWPTVVIWGHPEDIAALGVLAFSLAALLKGRMALAGWLLGLALAMQLYVVLAIPVFIGVVGLRKSPILLARAAILPGFLFVAVVIPNPTASLHALFQQPNFPKVDFPTPWASLAPSLGHGAVAAGPGRIVGFALAIALGVVASRRRDRHLWIVWLVGLTMAARCVTESVMDPYYVMPAVVFALVCAAQLGWIRFAIAAVAGAGLTELTYFRPGAWIYWLEMVGVLIVLFAVTWPRTRQSEMEFHAPREIDEDLHAIGPESDGELDPAKPQIAVVTARWHGAT